MRTYTKEEYKKRYGEVGYQELNQVAKKPNFVERTKQAASQGIAKVKEGLSSSTEEAGGNLLTGVGRDVRNMLKVGAGAIEAASAPLTAGLEPVIKPTLGRGVEFAADKISDNPSFQRFAESDAGEIIQRLAEDVQNLTTIVGTIGGARVAPKVGRSVNRAADAAITRTGQAVREAAQPLRGVVDNVGNISEPIVAEVKRLPSRFATNVANKREVQSTINKLPTQIAKEAAQDGVDIADVKFIYKIPKDQTTSLKKLATITKDFASGKTKTNPIEVVGKPIVNRLKEVERKASSVGKKLGDVADNLGAVTTKEVFPVVFNRLKKVPGLRDLTINRKGVLNFKDTVLATTETASDRAAIRRIFNNAIKTSPGKRKHLLRQELFETLGGKKRSQLNLTATQEKAYEAIREALSDILETKNPAYKTLSAEYRRLIQPIQEMRKLLRASGEIDDALDLPAGLLARRLTSLAQSNPQIRNLLNALDKATKSPGKTRLSIEMLQDFYNILEKYYDIAPKTGFQAQIKQGVEKAAGGPLNYLGEQIQSFAGETPAVRQKMLEKILDEVFK